MAIMIVTYDLRKSDHNYQPLYDYLKTFTHCWHIESVWMLDTALSAADIRDGMMRRMHANDRIFVGRLSGNRASWNYGCADWLNDPTRIW